MATDTHNREVASLMIRVTQLEAALLSMLEMAINPDPTATDGQMIDKLKRLKSDLSRAR
mgnify:CR=1 FL=1